MTVKEAEVRKQLSVLVILVEAASLAMLLIVLWRRIVPDTAGAALLLFLPIAFGLHVTEEFIWPGGFIAWDNILRPQFTETAGSFYVKVNAIPAVGSLLLALGTLSTPGGNNWSAVLTWLTIATFMSWNAVFHLRGAIRTKLYSPGMVTGLALFVPLTLTSYVHFVHAGLPPLLALVSAAIAFAIQPILNLIKRGGAKEAA